MDFGDVQQRVEMVMVVVMRAAALAVALLLSHGLVQFLAAIQSCVNGGDDGDFEQ